MNTNNGKQQPPSFPGDPTTEFQGTKMGNILNDLKPTMKTGAEKQPEGPIAKAIETRTSKLPSDTFLWLAAGSIGVSAALQLMGQKERSTFVGQWAPTFLVLDLYNKIVKLLGSESKIFQDRS
jgi:hypothetical protein